MVDTDAVGFRPPLTSVVPVAAVLSLFAAVMPFDGAWLFVITVVLVLLALRVRQLTVLEEDHLAVTVVRTRRIPWVDIQGFEPGSTLRGGAVVRTTAGDVRAVAPCSWWGGPADPADLATLRRTRDARARRH